MKNIIDEIDSRIKSPIFGYFIFSLIAINWSELFYLFIDTGSVSSRIEHFKNGTGFLSLFIYPLLTAFAYSTLYPWMQYIFITISTKPTELINSLQAESEHKLLTKKQELEETRSKILKHTETELIERAKRDAELKNIEDEETREKLQLEIERLRKEKDDSGSQSGKNEQLPEEQENIILLITSNGGAMTEANIVKDSQYDKVKTEYLLEDLLSKDYLSKKYKGHPVSDYVHSLTTKSKKIMVDKGVAK